jgi:hypothetical protein
MKNYYTVDLIPRNRPKRYRCVGYVIASDFEQAFREADRLFPHNGLEVLNVKLCKNQAAAERHYIRQRIEWCEFWELMNRIMAGEKVKSK